MEVDINEYAEGAILLDGLEPAIVGVTDEFGVGRRILYSKDKIIQILQERDGMTWDEAEEFFDYNIIGGYFGEQNPVFLDLSISTTTINENSYIYNLL
jgi:hypothetical protein